MYDEPLEVIVGPRHPLADARTARMADLREHRLWVPGIVPGSEWAGFYESLAETFEVDVDSTGSDFGIEHLLDVITESHTVATFVGARTRIARPDRHDLRRIELVDPTPLYPWSLVWHGRAEKPDLARLRDHLAAAYANRPPMEPSWSPAWATGEDDAQAS